MKKGVQLRIAGGVMMVLYLDLLVLIRLITGIDFFEESKLIYVIVFGSVVSFVSAKILSKNYDEIENYDKLFIVILGFLGCVFIGLVLYINGIIS